MCIGRNTENYKFEFDNLFLENSKKEKLYQVLQLTINQYLIVTLKIFIEKPAKTWCTVENNKLS